jgi:hypothetical protein
VGGRDGGWAREFMNDCASRVKGRVQITTDGHRVYLDAVEDAFGADVDYAQLQKIYGASDEPDTRYSPAVCIGCDMKVVSGDPDPQARQHQLCRAPKPNDADGNAALYSPNQCIQQKGRESLRDGCDSLHVL